MHHLDRIEDPASLREEALEVVARHRRGEISFAEMHRRFWALVYQIPPGEAAVQNSTSAPTEDQP